MPTQNGSKEVEKPAFDPHQLLAELEKIVKTNKDPTGGGKSWVGTLVILATVLVGVAVWSWVSWRRGRELAKLRHEKNRVELEALQAASEAAVAANAEIIDKFTAALRREREKLTAIKADIRAEEARYEADRRAIARIRSWRDIDPSVR